MKPTIKVTSKTTYTREEALKAALNYFKNDDLAASVWLNKYALNNILKLSPNAFIKHVTL